EVRLLKKWVDAGAPWEGGTLTVSRIAEQNRGSADWWSFRPIRRPPLPAVFQANWVRNPIDAFVLARLESAHLRPATECDRRTWIRRVTLDLVGLLPTPEEIDAFQRDDSPTAYERVVDRLLAS